MTSTSSPPSRLFGPALGLLCLSLAWISQRYGASLWVAGGLVVSGVMVAVTYSLLPGCRRPIVQAFQTITFPVRWLATVLAMGIVYYAVMTPIAIWFRLRGKSIHADPNGAETNWQPIELPTDPESYFRTF